MRVLIITDVHGNEVALEAVLADAKGQYDVVWCLGDLVGYGPNPNECVERVQELPSLICLVGNHDKAALGDIDLSTFNVDARTSTEWSQSVLNDKNREYLAGLTGSVITDGFTLAHGSPREPVWEYILDSYTALANFDYFNTRTCFVGHTHTPIIYHMFESACQAYMPSYDEELYLTEGRFIVNPGSVGQPRDGNPDAAYGILDTERNVFIHKRVPYDIAETQKRMREHELPMRLVLRLELGW